MRTEDINFIKRLKERQFFMDAVSCGARISGLKILNRIGVMPARNAHRSNYPAYISREASLKAPQYEKGFLQEFSSSKAKNGVAADAPFKGPFPIELAAQKIFSDGMPDWFKKFTDREDAFSLHRWGWLLMLGVNCPSRQVKNWGIEVMLDWFSKIGHMKNNYPWESYSVSERITNAILFLYCLRVFPYEKEENLDILEKNLIDMAVFLKDHLEFKGESTNNHILNNARALYMLGRFASSEELTCAGRQIFTEETPKMITPSGFLREGSSNYHLFLLRTYLEVLWTADYTEDNAFARIIKPVSESMVRAGWFFNVYDKIRNKWVVPFVGDVSPDFPADWIENVCTSEPALRLYNPFKCDIYSERGWNKIWGGVKPEKESPKPEITNYPKSELFSNSGWYRVDRGELTVFWHAPFDGPVPPYSHAHCDTCSFVVFWRGAPVIIDPGRFSYEKTLLGLYGKKATAHNTYTVDRLEPCPLPRNIYPPAYKRAYSSVDWKDENEGFRFKISHTGFCRINKEFLSSREFYVTECSIEIKDFIQGFGKHDVRAFFHFAPNLKLAEHPGTTTSLDIYLSNTAENAKIATFEFSFDAENAVKKILSGQIKPEPLGWYFPKYGKALPIKTMVVETEATFPYTAGYRMHFGNL